MFGKRADGRRLRNITPFFMVIPHIMKRRSDAQVYYSQEISLTPIDEYISRKEAEGINLSYMSIIYTALVRIIAERPRLNRFVMNGKTYARNGIDISLVVKKGMNEMAAETSTKLHFIGNENIFEIKKQLDKIISENKEVRAENSTDKLAKFLAFVPNWLMKLIVNLLMFLDKHDIMPKAVIKASPFHTSAFITNVGSLGIDSIYHHLYDFGTTGIFLAMGRKKKSIVYTGDDTLKEEKVISIRWVLDERICDGYYYASAVKSFNKYMKKPELLELNIDPVADI